MSRRTDKRAKLIRAAEDLNYQQGFRPTTLADIAQDAGVPLGNVYYYFKTKEDIGKAVISKRDEEINAFFVKLEEIIDPAVRIRAYIESNISDPEAIARYGCPIGGLCQELGKEGGILADQAAKLLHDIIKWTGKQFVALGISQEAAEEYALSLVSRIQGMNLLTLTFKDPSIATRQTQTIINWLESVVGNKVPAAQLAKEELAEAAY